MIIKKEPLSLRLARDIHRRISIDDLKRGERLPRQEKLAAMFGVSRVTLREALKQLALMGFIQIEHGKGTFVSSSVPASFFESLSTVFPLDKESTFKLLEARLHIESTLAFLAATRATEEEIKEMEALVEGMKIDLCEGRFEAFSEKDLDFHLLIANASKNPILAKIIGAIRDMLHQSIIESVVLIPGMSKESLNYHRRILRAIQKRDAEAAQKQMKNHISYVEQSIRKYSRLRNDLKATRETAPTPPSLGSSTRER